MLDTTVNSPLHDACTGISADGERMLLFKTSADLRSGDIYESFFLNNKWTHPKILGPIVNDPEFIETSACYSPDGDMIYFSSTRPGGFGGKDIYAVKKLPNGEWAKPFNLGPSVNTPYNEDAPFVHPHQKVLYFSSEGHRNMGGYDIFKSTFDENGVYSPAENMGSPINTVDDDIFFVMNTDASMGYFSSERTGGFGSQDIYSVYFSVNDIPLSVYNIHIKDEAGNVVKETEVLLTDMEKKSVYGIYKSNSATGKILVISPPEKQYRVAIRADGFEPLIIYADFGKQNDMDFTLTKRKDEK
jgi:hypothetical protein